MRKAKKLASARQQAWDEIRAQQEIDRVGTHPRTATPLPGARRPPLITAQNGIDAHGDAPRLPADEVTGKQSESARDSAARTRSGLYTIVSLVHPAVVAFTFVLLLVAGTPLVDGTWSLPWFAGSTVGTLVLLALHPRATRGAGTGPQVTGLALGVVVLLAGVAGIVGQNVVEGRAQLRGSDVDRAVEEYHELRHTLEILTENQGLLTLPPEQAIPLGAVYAEAKQQAIAIGQLWNPATKPVPPLPPLADAYELVNIAAAQQAAALEGFVANLENPEPAREAAYIERGIAVDALLQNGIPRALDAVDAAIRAAVVEGGQ